MVFLFFTVWLLQYVKLYIILLRELFISQGEIGRRSGGDNVLEREGHAVSAGFALGLVALGTTFIISMSFNSVKKLP